jgi:hypothetical protein
MPDRALIFTRTAARLAGAVLFEHWHYARTDPCRLSLSRALERDTTGAKTESHTWTLARPVGSSGARRHGAGTRAGNVGAVLVRVEGEAPPRTFQTVRKSTVTTDGVTPFVVGTTRTSGPVRWRWGVSLSVEA